MTVAADKFSLELTPDQAKAFNKLKAAYKACEKAGIYFANCYGTLQGYDSTIVAGYADGSEYDEGADDVVNAAVFSPSHSMTIANEWADDEPSHLIKLTPKGAKLKNGN